MPLFVISIDPGSKGFRMTRGERAWDRLSQADGNASGGWVERCWRKKDGDRGSLSVSLEA